MKQAEAHDKALDAWDNMRAKLGLKGHKYGKPRQIYLKQFCREADFSKPDLYCAMENFLTDPWWCDPEHVKFQDLEHFIRNYEDYLPDNYIRKEIKKKPFLVERA